MISDFCLNNFNNLAHVYNLQLVERKKRNKIKSLTYFTNKIFIFFKAALNSR
jgi:hypothetical protein